jgi:hypothetical protein
MANHQPLPGIIQCGDLGEISDAGIYGGAYRSSCLADLVRTFFPKIGD